MRRERADYERLCDNAALIALWAQAQERSGGGVVGDRLKLVKLAFPATNSLFWDKSKALNLRFFRYAYGPWTEQLESNWADLKERGLLVEDELFAVTDEGKRFADSFTSEVLGLEENKRIRNVFERIIEDYANLDTRELLDRVYDMRCYTLDSPGKKRLVRSMPQGRVFTGILEEEDAEESLVIPAGWQMTLDLTFDPDALRNLQRGIEDAYAGRLHGWEALGTDV